MAEIDHRLIEDLNKPGASGCAVKTLLHDVPLQERFDILQAIAKQGKNLEVSSQASASNSFAPDIDKTYDRWHLRLEQRTEGDITRLKLPGKNELYSETIDMHTLKTLDATAYDKDSKLCP